MDRDYDIEYEPNPDDERDVPLEEDEPSPPPTIDPEERIEEPDDELVEELLADVDVVLTCDLAHERG